MPRTGNQSDFYFFNPSQNPNIIPKNGKDTYRINPPIENPLYKPNQEDIHVDALKRYIERLKRNPGKRGFELDDQSAESLYRYLQVLVSVAQIEEQIKGLLKIYNRLRQNDDIQFPNEIKRKIRLLKRVRKQLLMMDINAEKRKKNRMMT